MVRFYGNEGQRRTQKVEVLQPGDLAETDEEILWGMPTGHYLSTPTPQIMLFFQLSLNPNLFSTQQSPADSRKSVSELNGGVRPLISFFKGTLERCFFSYQPAMNPSPICRLQLLMACSLWRVLRPACISDSTVYFHLFSLLPSFIDRRAHRLFKCLHSY